MASIECTGPFNVTKYSNYAYEGRKLEKITAKLFALTAF